MEGRAHGPSPDVLCILGRVTVRDGEDVPHGSNRAWGEPEGIGDHRGDGAADAPSQGPPEVDDAGDAGGRLEKGRAGRDPDGVGMADLQQVRLRAGERAGLVRDESTGRAVQSAPFRKRGDGRRARAQVDRTRHIRTDPAQDRGRAQPRPRMVGQLVECRRPSRLASTRRTACASVWHDDGGSAQGYVIYDPTEIWSDGVPAGEVHVRELMAATPDAYRELWRYICELDLVGTVRANHRPVDEPLVHLVADGRGIRTRARIDHLWVRLLDVKECLAGRSYSVPGRVVFEVDDPMSESVSRFAVEGDPKGGSAEVTRDGPEIVLGVTELGTAYLGGVSFAALAMSGRIDERVPGSVARADAMFGIRPLPWLTTNF